MKKLLAWLMVCAILTFGLSAAAESAAPELTTTPIVIHLEDASIQSIQPRRKYLTTAFTSMRIVDGKANCQANYNITSDQWVRISMQLQRCKTNSSNDADWSGVQSWVKSWTTSGVHILSKTSSALDSGWYYRLQSTITVLDDNELPLEMVVLISTVSRY